MSERMSEEKLAEIRLEHPELVDELLAERKRADGFHSERDRLAGEVELRVIEFRSIEASFGTIDQCEAIDDEQALPGLLSIRAAELADQYNWQSENIKQLNIAVHNQSQMLADHVARWDKLREEVAALHKKTQYVSNVSVIQGFAACHSEVLALIDSLSKEPKPQIEGVSSAAGTLEEK